ncbi:MAG: hypothetical protein KBC41_00345 [Candidatus Pacebacteria bacterium]|nr:hypothetical protein [Candidatus Paceibacterota bacterium]MBP9866516.1 hypothetical protein [Candidatus Paceibacterota bacterium]
MIVFDIILSAFIMCVVVFCYIVTISFVVWMIVDSAKQDRFWWLVGIIGVPIIGATIYYLTEKKHQYRQIEPHHIHESETEQQHENAPKKKRAKKVKENVTVPSVTSIESLEVIKEEVK